MVHEIYHLNLEDIYFILAVVQLVFDFSGEKILEYYHYCYYYDFITH